MRWKFALLATVAGNEHHVIPNRRVAGDEDRAAAEFAGRRRLTRYTYDAVTWGYGCLELTTTLSLVFNCSHDCG